MTVFDITATEIKPLTIPLPATVKAALTAQEIDAPEQIVMHLQEATLEERRLPSLVQDDVEGVVMMVMARAEEGTDERVVRELAKKMTASSVAVITAAYLTGELPDPKVVQAQVRRAMTIGRTGT
ncbi:hypothetical protein [Deinococcus navajonensis]|uniref:Uncharacterized protein n=1 Tax=Deinococcus navajonensis TaxID=309884 RepID=A0ABV8XNA0_9DEIO